MTTPAIDGPWRSAVLTIALLVLAVALFGGLQQLHAARVRYTSMAHAAGGMATTAAGLASLKWEVLAEQDAEADEVDEARVMIAAGDAYLAAMRALAQDAPTASVTVTWHRYSAGVMHVLALVQDGEVDTADAFEEDTLEPVEEALAPLVESVRVEALALDARAERVEVLGSTALIIGALAGFLTALTLSQRRRRSVVVAEVMRGARDTLRHQATHDALTGLGNRRLFTEMAAEQTALHQHGGGYAVLLLDLDDFKTVNDTLGHHCGDQLLTAVSQRLKGAMRGADLVARIGGDEFAILVTDVRDETTPALVAARILAALSAPVWIDAVPLTVRASIGIAISSSRGGDSGLLLRWADLAMYQAKRQGNSFAVYDPAIQVGNAKMLEPLVDEALSAP